MTYRTKGQGDLSFPEDNAGTGRLAHRAQGVPPGLGLATGGADANTHRGSHSLYSLYTRARDPAWAPHPLQI